MSEGEREREGNRGREGGREGERRKKGQSEGWREGENDAEEGIYAKSASTLSRTKRVREQVSR